MAIANLITRGIGPQGVVRELITAGLTPNTIPPPIQTGHATNGSGRGFGRRHWAGLLSFIANWFKLYQNTLM